MKFTLNPNFRMNPRSVSASVSNSASFSPPTWSNSSEESDGNEVIEGLPNPLRVGDTYGEVWRGYYKTKFDAVLTHREWVEDFDNGGANVAMYPFDPSLRNTRFEVECWIDDGPHYKNSVGLTTYDNHTIHDIDGTTQPPAWQLPVNVGMLQNPMGTMWKGTLHFYIFHQGRKMKYSIYCPG